jgi:ligand-binding sensor domain-containing protein
MKLNYLTTGILSILFLQTLTGQNYKNWNTHLAYHEATGVAETNERVYVLANGSLYSYGKENAEIRILSKQTGLSDNDIRLIKYNPDNQTLLIVYQNGNIDLLDKDGIRNMPDLKNNLNIQSKTINDIYLHGGYAYMAAEFGVLVVNTNKKEVQDTYKTANARSVCILNDSIYVATQNGLIQAHLKSNLLDMNNWEDKRLHTTEFAEDEIKRMCHFQHKLFFCVPGKGVFYEENGEIIALDRQIYIDNITVQNEELLTYTAIDLRIYRTTEDDLYVHISEGINDVVSLKNDGKYWVASGVNGLIGMEKGGDYIFTKIVSDISINSPKRNYNSFMTIQNNKKLLITGGDRTYDRLRRPGTLMIYENDKWYNFDESIANREISKRIGFNSLDYMGVAVDPDDENHYFIATYGEGVIELKDNEFVKLHHTDNSTLRSAVTHMENGQEKQSPDYVRTGSVCFDKNKNLWVTNCLVNNVIHVMNPRGEWVALYYPEIRNADRIDKILIRSNGHKWVNVPDEGIFVFDDNGTPEDSSDDRYNYFRTFRDAQSSTGAGIGASQYLSMAEDRSGTMWIGTNIGLLKCSSPSQAPTDPTLSCSRPVRDGEAYFLFGESVTAIAVDADNQKWVGTATQGVFLINEDGSETIHNFKTDNSPLLSNTIKSIAVNQETGEVFFGTDNGLVSYNSGVKSGAAPFSDVYAFPNPVRPEYNDKVTITGLTNQANVKITDINGNLIFQGRAVGNQIVWNCRNSTGSRVATGVYLVLATTSDASESVVTKIAVVK